MFIMSFSLYTPAIDPLVSICLSPLMTWGVFGGTEIGKSFLERFKWFKAQKNDFESWIFAIFERSEEVGRSFNPKLKAFTWVIR